VRSFDNGFGPCRKGCSFFAEVTVLPRVLARLQSSKAGLRVQMLNGRMSRGLTLTVGVAIVFFATCGMADGPYDRDIYVEPLLPASPFRWTGLYVSGNLGGAWPTVTLSGNLTGNGFSADQSGFIGGAQIGCNYQLDSLVLGMEWDFD